MPNIAEFDAGNLDIRPSETGVESVARAGLRIGAFYNQTAQLKEQEGARLGQSVKEAGDTAVDYMDHQQINAGADHGTNLRASLQDSWNQTSANADPHDPSVAKKWREETLQPALDQFAQGFTTEKSQDWANHFANETRSEFFNKSEADMSSLAKDAVVKTVSNMGNQLSNMAVSDPSSVDASVAMVDHSIDGILGANPNIKGADAGRVKLEVGEKLKEQIIKAGAFGAIQNADDPVAAAASWAAKYPDYINGPEELALAKAAKVQERSNTLLTKQTQIADRQLATQNVDASRNKIFADNVTIDPTTNRPNIKPDFFAQAVKIPSQYPNAPNAIETAKTLLDWGEAQQKEPKGGVSDPGVLADLSSRLFSPDNPTTEIQLMKAQVDATQGKPGISKENFAPMLELVKALQETPIRDPAVKDTMQAVKDKFTFSSTNGADDPMGSANYARFIQAFTPEYLKQVRAGTLQPNALDTRDPNSLISAAIRTAQQPLQAQLQNPNKAPAIPPAGQRMVNSVYQTPKGPARWMGDGWQLVK